MSGKQYINPDEIANYLGGWNNPEKVLQAAQTATSLRNHYLRNNQSFAFETVFSTQEKVNFLKQAKAADFFIRFFYICTDDPKINIERIRKRVLQNKHAVPEDKVIKRYHRSLRKVKCIFDFADRCYFYDNSHENKNVRLLFRTNKRVIEKTYIEKTQQPEWAKLVYEVLVQPPKK